MSFKYLCDKEIIQLNDSNDIFQINFKTNKFISHLFDTNAVNCAYWEYIKPLLYETIVKNDNNIPTTSGYAMVNCWYNVMFGYIMLPSCLVSQIGCGTNWRKREWQKIFTRIVAAVTLGMDSS
jgi:hypothetical protein